MAIKLGSGGEMAVILKVKDDGSVVVEKFGDNADKSLDKAGKGADKAGKSFKKMSADVKKYTAIAAAAVSVILAGGVKIGAAFEQSIANVGSVAGASQAQLKTLARAARDQAKVSIFAARDAADAQYFLASAGLSVNEVIKAQGGIMALAAATQSDLARTSEIVTSTLAQFSLRAEESQRVADVFAAAISGSQANMQKLGDAMRYVGPVAQALQIDLESTTAAVSLLFNAGFRGEQAGTVLRASLIALKKPSTEAASLIADMGLQVNAASGKFVGFGPLIDQLAKKQLNLNEAATLFGSEAAPGMLALVNQGSAAFENMRDKITGTNKAQEMASAQTDTLTGDWKLFKSQLEETSLTIYDDIGPAVRSLVKSMTDLVRAMTPVPRSLADIQAELDRLESTGLRGRNRTGTNALIERLKAERDAALAALPGLEGVSEQLDNVEQTVADITRRRAELIAEIDSIPEADRQTTSGSGRNQSTTVYGQLNAELEASNAQLTSLVAQRESLIEQSLSLGPDSAKVIDPFAIDDTAGANRRGTRETEETIKLRDELAKQTDALAESYLTERELLFSKYADEQFLLEDALLNKVITQSTYQDLLLQSATAYETNLTKLTKKSADDRTAYEVNISKQVGNIRQSAYDHGINLLRKFAEGNKTITLILIALQTTKAVKDIQIQAAAASAQVYAYGQIEAAAHAAIFDYAGAAAALARMTAAIASINIAAGIGTALAIASGIVDAKNLDAGEPGTPNNPISVASQDTIGSSTSSGAFDTDTGSSSPAAPALTPAQQRAVVQQTQEINLSVRATDVFTASQFTDGITEILKQVIGDGAFNINVDYAL